MVLESPQNRRKWLYRLSGRHISTQLRTRPRGVPEIGLRRKPVFGWPRGLPSRHFLILTDPSGQLHGASRESTNALVN